MTEEKQYPTVGDTVILGAPGMRPQYLNGAHVRITGVTRTRDGHGWETDDETKWWVYQGVITQVGPGPKKSYRNRVGQRVGGIRESIVQEILPEPVAA